jgi:ABC-type branched-subunit amino acid transport system ATPase component
LRQTGVATLLIEQNARSARDISDYAYVIETYLGLVKKSA